MWVQDELQCLKAENKQLREALEEIDLHCPDCGLWLVNNQEIVDKAREVLQQLDVPQQKDAP